MDSPISMSSAVESAAGATRVPSLRFRVLMSAAQAAPLFLVFDGLYLIASGALQPITGFSECDMSVQTCLARLFLFASSPSLAIVGGVMAIGPWLEGKRLSTGNQKAIQAILFTFPLTIALWYGVGFMATFTAIAAQTQIPCRGGGNSLTILLAFFLWLPSMIVWQFFRDA